MLSKLKENKILLYSVIIGILLVFIIGIFNTKSENVKNDYLEPKKEIIKEETESKIKYVTIDIKGSVINPGVYSLKEDSRVIDQTTPNMIQRISEIFERKPLISKEI